ncbi:hypothetical protein HYALB_00003185 [Hymenoscyphus albidus]|uniref:RWD domain-containing protein n=1 Tax=Hymenoscyphus albidus TaxID=595503 RepID=A0A9N9Q1T2_9HELO|nr:hypothetical protein HYALB_00003185 [Hymenoscyphus albidus]
MPFQVTVVFLRKYPLSTSPTTFTIQANDVSSKLKSKDLQKPASIYTSRKQNFLEPVLRYLIGSISWEEATTFYDDVQDDNFSSTIQEAPSPEDKLPDITTLALPCRSLRIGSWNPVKGVAMDLTLLSFPAISMISYNIRDADVDYMIEYPFSSVKRLMFAPNDSNKEVEESERIGHIVLQLQRPPNFTRRFGSVWQGCDDHSSSGQQFQTPENNSQDENNEIANLVAESNELKEATDKKDSTTQKLVKVYELQGLDWIQLGSGNFTWRLMYNKSTHNMDMRVTVSSNDHRNLFKAYITTTVAFKKEQDTAIKWKDPSSGAEFTISFPEAESCTHAWNRINGIQERLLRRAALDRSSEAEYVLWSHPRYERPLPWAVDEQKTEVFEMYNGWESRGTGDCVAIMWPTKSTKRPLEPRISIISEGSDGSELTFFEAIVHPGREFASFEESDTIFWTDPITEVQLAFHFEDNYGKQLIWDFIVEFQGQQLREEAEIDELGVEHEERNAHSEFEQDSNRKLEVVVFEVRDNGKYLTRGTGDFDLLDQQSCVRIRSMLHSDAILFEEKCGQPTQFRKQQDLTITWSDSEGRVKFHLNFTHAKDRFVAWELLTRFQGLQKRSTEAENQASPTEDVDTSEGKLDEGKGEEDQAERRSISSLDNATPALKSVAKNVTFELHFGSLQSGARSFIRVQIVPDDTTDTIVSAIENYDSRYKSLITSKKLNFKDKHGRTLIPRYENLQNNAVVNVNIDDESTQSSGALDTMTSDASHEGSSNANATSTLSPNNRPTLPSNVNVRDLDELYLLILQPGKEPCFRLKEWYYNSPELHKPNEFYLDRHDSTENTYSCYYPDDGCWEDNSRPVFATASELESHYENVHHGTYLRLSCDYRGCVWGREYPFATKEMRRDHYSMAHGDILVNFKSYSQEEKCQLEAERNIRLCTWRCAKCLYRMGDKIDNWTCPLCNIGGGEWLVAGMEPITSSAQEAIYRKIQEDELLTLATIYGEDFQKREVVDGRSPALEIILRTSDPDIWVSLNVRFQEAYPNDPPIVSLGDITTNLEVNSPSCICMLQDVITNKTKELAGGEEGIIVDIVNACREVLETQIRARASK